MGATELNILDSIRTMATNRPVFMKVNRDGRPTGYAFYQRTPTL